MRFERAETIAELRQREGACGRRAGLRESTRGERCRGGKGRGGEKYTAGKIESHVLFLHREQSISLFTPSPKSRRAIVLALLLAGPLSGSRDPDNNSVMRQRIDQLLVERGLFESRALARAAIEAGLVRADGAIIDKPSRAVPAEARLEAGRPFETVSRAGLKLQAALDHAAIAVEGLVCLDLGASTGGFSDLLLQRGAARVHAVDVGHGQLHARLRAHPRLVNHEGLDARAVTADHVPEEVDLLVADLSFIGLAKALPAGLARVKQGGSVIALIKPQFEAGPNAGKRGVIRDEARHAAIIARVSHEVAALGVAVIATLPSPIEGGDGNREFLLIGTRR
jgi:23S rRNA (cytidine1920-2'-O)/16S rRNA (cytidine1409-2'-O)-methyltransferase